LISQPDTGEQALKSATPWCARRGRCAVIDSVAALVPRAELEARWARAARTSSRLMSQALRKLTASITSPTMVLHQPDPDEDRVMYGSPETTRR